MKQLYQILVRTVDTDVVVFVVMVAARLPVGMEAWIGTEVPQQVTPVIERFIIHKPAPVAVLLTKPAAMKRIPSTHAALEQHVRRAVFQRWTCLGVSTSFTPNASFSK